MIVKNARISNFKSLTNENNVLAVEKTITALIGKNESGKSNVLQALGFLDTLAPLNANYKQFATRDQSEVPTILITLSFSDDEKNLYDNISEDTSIFYNYSDVEIKGGFSSLISKDEVLASAINNLIDVANSNSLGFSSANLVNFRTHIHNLKTIDQKIHSDIFFDLSNASNIINDSIVDTKAQYIEYIDTITEKLRDYYNLIPQVYYRPSDDVLKDVYSFEEIKRLFGNNNLFNSLMVAANIDKETLFGAFQNSNDASLKTSRKKIQNNINKITDEFNNYYTQEHIQLDFDVESGVAKLFISTADRYMSFSERSNGLKWYFSLFIDTKAKIDNNRSTLYLLDEPGVYLHVKAQKELLQYFNHLCDDGNQVIYTTHSPFMIDNNNVYNIRAVEKDEYGNSKIYKSIYNHQLSEKSKMETLSPLIEAFGMELRYNIGPQCTQNNVIVEGVTDAMYFTAMLNYFNVSEDKRPHIIPCAGVNNINHVASILTGWGCNFKVVLDHDTQGFSEYKLITQKTSLLDENIVFFVNLEKPEKEQDVKDEKSATTESLVSNVDNEKLFNKYNGTKNTKSLAAKEFLDKVTNGEIIPNQETIDNFKNLFITIGINIK